IRTQDPQLRRLLLYPAELPDHPLLDFVRLKTTLFPYVRTYSMHLATAKVALFQKPHKFIGNKILVYRILFIKTISTLRFTPVVQRFILSVPT
ncbi:MAG: hypothetical protein J1F40_06425, partial [Prevotellaceae bacterium]|nr:hypothetical protein [Prevotellaceae bacterium]